MNSSLEIRKEIGQISERMNARFDAFERRFSLQLKEMEFRIVSKLGAWMAFLLSVFVLVQLSS